MALFATTLTKQAFSRRGLVLAVLYLLPVGLALLMRRTDAGFRGPNAGHDPLFAEFLLIFNLIPQALVPLTALVYASGMIQDEIEEQTITYLLIRPLPRWLIYVCKLAATMVVTAGITAVFTAITFLAIAWGEPDYRSTGWLIRMGKTIVIFSLITATYDALFGFLSLVMKRALLVGIGYILLLEGYVANLDFIIRKATVMYYLRVLCERWMDFSGIWPTPGRMDYNIDFQLAPTLWGALTTIVGTIVVLTFFASLVVGTREFRVKTPEGN